MPPPLATQTIYQFVLVEREKAMEQREATMPAEPEDARRVRPRLVQRERSDQVVAIGLRTPWLRDLYHQLMTLPWWAFLTGFAGLYILLNVLFATLYLLDAEAIANVRP